MKHTSAADEKSCWWGGNPSPEDRSHTKGKGVSTVDDWVQGNNPSSEEDIAIDGLLGLGIGLGLGVSPPTPSAEVEQSQQVLDAMDVNKVVSGQEQEEDTSMDQMEGIEVENTQPSRHMDAAEILASVRTQWNTTKQLDTKVSGWLFDLSADEEKKLKALPEIVKATRQAKGALEGIAEKLETYMSIASDPVGEEPEEEADDSSGEELPWWEENSSEEEIASPAKSQEPGKEADNDPGEEDRWWEEDVSKKEDDSPAKAQEPEKVPDDKPPGGKPNVPAEATNMGEGKYYDPARPGSRLAVTTTLCGGGSVQISDLGLDAGWLKRLSEDDRSDVISAIRSAQMMERMGK